MSFVHHSSSLIQHHGFSTVFHNVIYLWRTTHGRINLSW